MCPVALEKAVRDRLKKGQKPKAIIYVHLYGMPAKVKELQIIADKYDIPLVEDAAEALGSMYMDEHCGNLGLLSILSFNGNKIITTSGGGALLSNNAEYVSRARFLATQARDPAPHYQHSVLGYNYRMSNICASIGRGQMTTLPEKVRKRRENFQWYKEIFKEFPGVEFQSEPTESISNRWLTSILIDEKLASVCNENLRHAFEENNIEARPVWKPMHLQPVFNGAPFYGNGNSESIFRKGLCLPSGSSLTENDKSRIEEVVHKVFDHSVIQPRYSRSVAYA
jgi:dTDP-4-amino-4,6-dideoxygalactose transaminase